MTHDDIIDLAESTMKALADNDRHRVAGCMFLMALSQMPRAEKRKYIAGIIKAAMDILTDETPQ